MFTSTFHSTLAKADAKYSNELKESHKALWDDFSSKRMMTKEMWEERIKLNDVDEILVARSIYQLHYRPDIMPKRKFYDWELNGDIQKYAVEDFCHPQKELAEKLYLIKRSAYSFLPKPTTVENLQQMYSNIKAAEGDDKKWLEALVAFDDHDFVCHNVEYRLGGDLTNKSLWLMYIEYLKTHDTEKLLQTYSKYIRFFLEDVKMIAEYREAVKKYGPVLVPWKNPLDFETYDENFFEKEKARQSYKRTLYDESPPCLIRFNPETAATQDFPFFPKLMIYIRENASPEVLYKLYKSCKLFPARFPKTICCRMIVENRITPFDIKGLCINISGRWSSNITLDNVIIADQFFFACGNPLALSKFLPKIYRCDAKFIDIYYQQLTMDELQKLIGHENLSSLTFWCNKNSDGQRFKIEDILQVSPYVKEIDLHDVHYTPETAKKLCEMEFKNKIERIFLWNLNSDLLDPCDFAKFITKNCKPDALIRIAFNFDGKEAYVKKFKEAVESAIKNHWKGSDKIKSVIN